MEKNIKEELEKFKEFKKKFVFKQKEFVQDGENIYCDGEILCQGEDKIIGETEKWINAGYKFKGTFSKALSNLFPYEFTFKDKKLSSIEAFFQGIKIRDKDVQNYAFNYKGIDANTIKAASDFDWKETGTIYWQGIPIKRDGEEYNELVDELYISAIQNPLYRNVLKNVDRPIIHYIGKNDKSETVFTRYEFEYMLNCLVTYLKENI